MEPIKVGDLVVIVRPRPCCGSADSIGKIRRVIGVPIYPTTTCDCGLRWIGGAYGAEVLLSSGSVCQISRMKRIDPLPSPEAVDEEEEA